MHDTYELIGGEGAAKAILTHSLGTIGVIRYAGEVRTVFLRAHDDVTQTAAGDNLVSPAAYIAAYGTYESIEELVSDSDVTFDREEGDVLAWKVTPDEFTPLCRYDSTLTVEDEEGVTATEIGNDEALAAALKALPAGCGFLIGDYTSRSSAFVLGFRTVDGVLSSGCGPSLTSKHFADTVDMSDILDDPSAEASAVEVLAVFPSR